MADIQTTLACPCYHRLQSEIARETSAASIRTRTLSAGKLLMHIVGRNDYLQIVMRLKRQLHMQWRFDEEYNLQLVANSAR